MKKNNLILLAITVAVGTAGCGTQNIQSPTAGPGASSQPNTAQSGSTSASGTAGGLTSTITANGNGSPATNGTNLAVITTVSGTGTSISTGITTTTVGGWTTTDQKSNDGTVTLSQQHMTEDQQAIVRNTYRRTSLVPIPVDSKYNANLFRISDDTIPDFKDQAFNAPLLYSYGGPQGGRIFPTDNSDGTVTISFNVAFLDGTKDTIQSPKSDRDEESIPDIFTIKDKADLMKSLADDHQIKKDIARLPGCPKRVTVMAFAQEYDATPSDFARGDYCQINVPFSISIRVPKNDADLILNQALPNGFLDVTGIYETRASFPVAKVEVSFDRSKLYSDLQAELGVKAWYFDADVKLAVTKVIQSQMMKVTVQGDTNAALDKLISQATSEFFEPFKADPLSPIANPCGDAVVCLQLSSTSLRQSSLFNFQLDQESDEMAGQNWWTTTKLKAMQSETVLGMGASCTSNCNRVSNDGVPRDTGLTVNSGTIINIIPSYVVQQMPDAPADVPAVITHNIVCNHTIQQCTVPMGDGPHGHRDLKPMEDFMSLNSCVTVCDGTEDHWTSTKTINVASIKEGVVVDPVGKIDVLFSGLSLQFNWTTHDTKLPQVTECPLSVFPRNGDGKSMTVTLLNSPGCSPFTGNPFETPTVSLVNRISMPPVPYQSGRLVTLWNGTATERPSVQKFYPRVDFAGTVSVEGYGFSSSPEKSQFNP